MNGDNPFAKNESVQAGKDVSWKVDKKNTLATKTASDGKGTYYHLQFNNKQLKLLVSSDASGTDPKGFTQLQIQDVQIDGEQNPVFKWCLNNQQKHNRYLQQGLSVKKNICIVNGGTGTFVMNLNKDTLASLKKSSNLSIMLKPYRTPLDLSYDISDFNDMYVALNAKAAPVATAAAASKVAKPKKMCKAAAPAKYKNIKPLEYECGNAAAKSKAEAGVVTLVNQEKAKEQRLAAEREKQRKLAEEKKQQELALKLQQEQQLQAEAAALAASEAKQAQIGSDIADKMVSMCEKYWSKGEHRCYCEKYIDSAPAAIQASSTCK